jgi:5'-3' exonuclease
MTISFKDLREKAYPTINKDLTILVDADSLIYRVAFAQEKQGVLMGSKEDAINQLDFLISDIQQRCESEKLEFHLTSGKNFRYDVAKTVPYKGNRKDMEKPRLYKDILKHMIKVLKAQVHEGLEADDFMRIRFNELGRDNCIIVAVDKDIYQIPALIYNYVKGEFVNVSYIDGFRRLYTQFLVGDTSDNIIGIKGVGKVRAEKALMGCTSEQELYSVVMEFYKKEFGEFADDRFIENLQLLWLRDTPEKTAIDSFEERRAKWLNVQQECQTLCQN